MGKDTRMLKVNDEDVLNLENIRDILMNLNNTAGVASRDIIPEVLTLNGLIEHYREKNSKREAIGYVYIDDTDSTKISRVFYNKELASIAATNKGNCSLFALIPEPVSK